MAHLELSDKGQPTFALGRPYVPAGHVSVVTAKLIRENRLFSKINLELTFSRFMTPSSGGGGGGQNTAKIAVNGWENLKV